MRDAGPPAGPGDPRREDLRPLLRQWPAPLPPRQIEDDLRRAFRRRAQPGRSRAAWLAVAATVVAAAIASPLWLASRPAPTTPRTPGPAVSGSVSRSVPPPSVSPGALEAGAATLPDVERTRAPQETPNGGRRAVAVPRHAPSRLGPARADDAVVVEAGQVALLAQLGASLGPVQPLVSEAAAPRVRTFPSSTAAVLVAAAPATEAPRYRGEWDVVEGEWPLVQRAVPARER